MKTWSKHPVIYEINMYFAKTRSRALFLVAHLRRRIEIGDNYVHLAALSYLARNQYLGLALRAQPENWNYR
jgi:hypothetical protein